MSDFIEKFLNNFSQWHEIGLTIIKTIIAIGVLCLVAYLLTISYIPSEISFGDTLVFLLIFASCAVVYSFLIMVLFFFGSSLMPLVYFIFKFIDRYSPPHLKIEKNLIFPKISITTIVVSVCFLYLIRNILLIHWKFGLYLFLTSAFIALFCYPLYVNRQKLKVFNAKFENLDEIIDDPNTSEHLKSFAKAKNKQFEKNITNITQSTFFLILTPLIFMVLIADIGKLFLNYTMQNIGVRAEKVTVYLKEPYASLVQLPKTTTDALSQQQIFKIKDVNILFQGVGKNTLLSYRLDGFEQKIIIPNEFIIVEQRRKLDESK